MSSSNISNISFTCNQTVENNTNTTEEDSTLVYNYIVGCILLVTTILSIVINGIVVYVIIIRHKIFLNRINLYLVVVSLLALIISVFGCPMVVVSSFSGQWYFGNLGCKYYAFLMTFCGLSTIFILAMISVDRYSMIIHNVFQGPDINKFSLISICSCLLVSLLLSSCPLIGWNDYTFDEVTTACSPDIRSVDIISRSYLVTLLCFGFVLPLTVMVFCYCKIFITIKEIMQDLSPSVHNNSPIQMRRQTNLTFQLKLAYTFMYIVGTFLICWTPYAITIMLSMFYPELLSPMETSIPSMITKTGTCFTPIVYLGRDRKMRRVIIYMIPYLKNIEK